jgi:hypothetical protein
MDKLNDRKTISTKGYLTFSGKLHNSHRLLKMQETNRLKMFLKNLNSDY